MTDDLTRRINALQQQKDQISIAIQQLKMERDGDKHWPKVDYQELVKAMEGKPFMSEKFMEDLGLSPRNPEGKVENE